MSPSGSQWSLLGRGHTAYLTLDSGRPESAHSPHLLSSLLHSPTRAITGLLADGAFDLPCNLCCPVWGRTCAGMCLAPCTRQDEHAYSPGSPHPSVSSLCPRHLREIGLSPCLFPFRRRRLRGSRSAFGSDMGHSISSLGPGGRPYR